MRVFARTGEYRKINMVLSRHERRLGIKSDLVLNYNTWINYNVTGCWGNTPTPACERFSDVLSLGFLRHSNMTCCTLILGVRYCSGTI